MTAVVATVFESGHYERGAAALINSLIAAGFSGRVWCGVRGPEPSWLTPQLNSRLRATSVEVRSLPITTSYAVPDSKPHFLLQIAELEPTCSVIAYFDADLVVKCPWSFVERWSSSGIAAVADANWLVPKSSPMRAQLRDLRSHLNVPRRADEQPAPLDIYCNAGFVGLNVKHRGFLQLWADLTDALLSGHKSLASQRAFPNVGPDQDLFNLALMGYGSLASLMGPEAMDFAPGGSVFSHAIGSTKPWLRHYLRDALKGLPPSKRDAFYIKYSRGPVGPVPLPRHVRRALAYRMSRGLGMFMQRLDY
jgi:hypothetical protein